MNETKFRRQLREIREEALRFYPGDRWACERSHAREAELIDNLVKEFVTPNPTREGEQLPDVREGLKAARVLWRGADTLSLWAIPYAMRPGQQPRDLADVGNMKGWLWLGCPGWFGSISKGDQELIKAFLAEHAEEIPQGPNEWTELNQPANG